MVKRKKSKKTPRKKQKGGFFISGILKRAINASGGIKTKDGKKRKFNLKHSPYRTNEPFWQKGGTAVYTKKESLVVISNG